MVNLPLTEPRLEGNNGSPLSEDDSKDTTHNQHTIREQSEYLTPTFMPNWSSNGEMSRISFGLSSLLRESGAGAYEPVWK